MPRLATLAFLFPSAFAAAAGIQIQSRTSTLNAVRVDPDPALRWNETATATALGEFSLSTPHGGTFSGSSWRTCFSSPCSESRSSSLEVTFVITGPPADLLLEMWGTSWPPGNAILRITNLAGTVEHFNADWIATNPGSSQSPQEWSSATWTGQTGPLAPGYGFLGGSVILQRFDGFIFATIFNTLSLPGEQGAFNLDLELTAGEYRLIGDSNASAFAFAGGAASATAENSWSYDLTIVPAPASALVLAAGGLLRRRRR
jgi:hypothetical protein